MIPYGSMFSGYGGLDLAVEAAIPGARPAWFVEVDPAPARVLAAHWPGVPNLGDVTKVDWSQVEPVRILTQGFPCQDVSHAGKRAGLTPDSRSGLWSYSAHAISVLRPELVIIENVRGLLSAKAERSPDAADIDPDALEESHAQALRAAADQAEQARDVGPEDGDVGDDEPAGPVHLRAMGAVLGDLADLGYDAKWRGVLAADAGAPHARFRVFIVARPAT